MTENNKDKLVRYFEDKPIEFIEHEGRIWITGKAIEGGLELSEGNINRIYSRHKIEIEPYTRSVKMSTLKGLQDTRLYRPSVGHIEIPKILDKGYSLRPSRHFSCLGCF